MLLPSVSKEVRALALPWLGCLACLVVPAIANAPMWLGGLSAPAYFLGAAAIGGMSIGHEYNDRTLSLLLTLPVRRERLFAIKLAVLAVMLLILWAVASALVFSDARLADESSDMAALIPVLYGLFLAPWFTMACRNPIGGAVFALAVPGVLLVAGELIGIRLYGHGSDTEDFRATVASFGTIGLCAVGAVLGWGTFTRLEAIEGPGQAVRLPRWLRTLDSTKVIDRGTRQHPLWLLVKKEISLQQLPLVLAGFYILAWLVGEALMSIVSDVEYRHAFGALSLPYGLLLALLIGSSASAAERQIGTLEWQTLLPIAAWKQWVVKVGVVFGLAVALAFGLPILLLYFGGLVRPDSIMSLMAARSAITVVIVATTASVYVSSLSRSGLRALVMSIPALFGATLFLQFVAFTVGGVTYTSARRFFTGMTQTFTMPVYFYPQRTAMLLLLTGFVTIALRYAYVNHRSAARPGRNVAVQVLIMAAFATIAVMAAAVWQAFRR
jgi:ABC-type transport system involved in multi-copper enzyme maturation permease subunit